MDLSPEDIRRRRQNGLLAGLGTYIIWGVLPVYWKMLGFMDPVLILLHRIFWSFLLLFLLQLKDSAWRESFAHLRNKRAFLLISLRSLLLSSNWLVFIWAVNSGHILETSLGYFLNPLLSMLAGVFFFRERPNFLQWLSIGLAFAGVGLQIILFGDIPWVALSLGFNFAIYGAMRKADNRGSLEGLFQETAIIMPVVLAGLVWYACTGDLGLSVSPAQTGLIICSGIFTSTPLLLFAYSAQRLNMTTVGLLQYIAPSISFLIGVFAYGEEVSYGKMISFGFIWVALAIYSVESLRLYNKATKFGWRD